MKRRQEFAADAVAARIAGTEAALGALRRIEEVAPGFELYWDRAYAGPLNAGVRPPLAEGFRRFLAQEQIAAELAAGLERRIAEERDDPFSTHPPLRHRLAAVAARPATVRPADARPALDLVSSIAAVELELLAAVLDADLLARTRAAPWEEVVERASVPTWRAHLNEIAEGIRDFTIGDLPSLAADPRSVARAIGPPTRGS